MSEGRGQARGKGLKRKNHEFEHTVKQPVNMIAETERMRRNEVAPLLSHVAQRSENSLDLNQKLPMHGTFRFACKR